MYFYNDDMYCENRIFTSDPALHGQLEKEVMASWTLKLAQNGHGLMYTINISGDPVRTTTSWKIHPTCYVKCLLTLA